MTNLEWIRTLSEEEFADWLYDEWLHHLQYRWSSSRGGLIIWLKDLKTEPTISKMEQVDKDINVRSKDEPQAGEMMTEEEFDSMLARALTGKNEPQTNADQHVQHVGSVEQMERSE